jgi:predicted Rossmann-fold nucleotide-binding protein
MLRKVISGGQTGVDQAGLRAARAVGLATGGSAPRGWETEDGPAPWLAECEREGYLARTEANVRASDGTMIFFGSSVRPVPGPP